MTTITPLAEIFHFPFRGSCILADIMLDTEGSAKDSVLYYNGEPTLASFVRAELVAAGVPRQAAMEFLSSSVAVNFSALGDLADAFIDGDGRGVSKSLSRIWDAIKHPRGWHGWWGMASGGIGGTTSKPATTVLDLADAGLRESGIDNKKAATYRATLLAVVGGMTLTAQKRIAENVWRFHFAPNCAAVGSTVKKRLKELGVNTKIPRNVIGAYINGSPPGKSEVREIVLDGHKRRRGTATSNTDVMPESQFDALGTYAHELGHALDGPDFRISKSNAWREAWAREILNGKPPPSVYAQTNEAEGFAEFSRLVTANTKVAKTMYPKCATVWKSYGLLS